MTPLHTLAGPRPRPRTRLGPSPARRRSPARPAGAPSVPLPAPGQLFTLADLVAAAGHGIRYSDVLDWLAEALATGRAVPAGFAAERDGRPFGSRCYRLR